MATRVTFRLPADTNHHDWLAEEFPGVTFTLKQRRSDGLVVVETDQDVGPAGRTAAQEAVLAAWTEITWESIP